MIMKSLMRSKNKSNTYNRYYKCPHCNNIIERTKYRKYVVLKDLFNDVFEDEIGIELEFTLRQFFSYRISEYPPFGSMLLLEFSDKIKKCGNCHNIFWFKDLKSKKEYSKDYYVNNKNTNEPLSISELLTVLKDVEGKNVEKEKIVRILIWNAFNLNSSRRGKSIISKEEKAIWKNNCKKLLELIGKKKSIVHKLITVELYRNLGEFDKCIKLLNEIPAFELYVYSSNVNSKWALIEIKNAALKGISTPFILKGEFEDTYKLAIELDPNDPIPYYKLVCLYIYKKRVIEAAQYFIQGGIIKKNFFSYNVLKNKIESLLEVKAKLYFKKNKYDEVIEYYQDLLSKQEPEPIKSNSYVHNKRFQEERRVESNYSTVRFESGNNYLKLEKYADAITEYKKAIKFLDFKLYIDVLDVYRNEFKIRESSLKSNSFKDYQKSREFLNSKKHTVALEKYYKAMSDLGFERSEKVIDEHITAINRELDKCLLIDLHISLGIAYAEKLNYKNAIKCFRKIIDLYPTYVANNIVLYDSVIHFSEKAIELYPENYNAYFCIGHIHFVQRRNDLALEWYNKAIKLNNRDALLYFYIGYVHANNQDFEKAIKFYTNSALLGDNFAKEQLHLWKHYSYWYKRKHNFGIALVNGTHVIKESILSTIWYYYLVLFETNWNKIKK